TEPADDRRASTSRVHKHAARAPIWNARRVERRLARLVLDEHTPLVWRRRVDFLKTVPNPLEAAWQLRAGSGLSSGSLRGDAKRVACVRRAQAVRAGVLRGGRSRLGLVPRACARGWLTRAGRLRAR